MERQEKSWRVDRQRMAGRFSVILGGLRGPGCFALAFLLCGGSLMDYVRPFGLCYAMSRDEHSRLWACAGAFAGSLMIYGSGGMVYAAACIVALAVDAFLLSGSRAREIFLPAALAAVIVIIKAPFALLDGASHLLMLMLEGGVTAFCCYCLMLEGEEKAGIRRAVMAIMLVTSLWGAKILGLLSPAVQAAAVMTMAASWVMPSFGGTAFGLAAGAFLDMASGGGVFHAAMLAIPSAAASVLPKRGRISFCLVYLAAGLMWVIFAFGGRGVMGYVYDIFIASSVFLLLPDSLFARHDGDEAAAAAERPADIPRDTSGGESRLRELVRAVGVMSKSMGEQIEREKSTEEDVCVIFDNAASKVCRSCRRCGECWIEGYMQTLGWMCDLLPAIREKGHIEPEELNAPGAAPCIKKDELCGAINREYMELLRRRAARRREYGRDALLKEQYDGIGAVIEGMAGAASAEYLPRPISQKQARAVMASYDRGIGVEVYSSRGRLNMRVGPFEEGTEWVDEPSFIASCALALDTSFMPPERVSCGGGYMLHYKERETLAFSAGTAVRKKEGEKACGDSVMCFDTGDGRAVIMLSDGMGAGEEASRLSKNALELMAAFIRSGCCAWDSARAVIPFLKAKYGFSGFATLDVLEIELFTGACRMIKCGAADSFLIRSGQVTRLSKTELPPGPGESAAPEPIDLYVRDGDRIVMMTDGSEIGDLHGLCSSRLSAGDILHMCPYSGDDLTAVVIDISNADKTARTGE